MLTDLTSRAPPESLDAVASRRLSLPPLIVLTKPRSSHLLTEVRSVVLGLAVGPVRLESRQEFEQSLLRDLAASSLQLREGCEAEAALQPVLLGLEVLVSRREAAALGAAGLCRRRRRSGAGHDLCLPPARHSTAWHGGPVAHNSVMNTRNDEWSARPYGRERAAALLSAL